MLPRIGPPVRQPSGLRMKRVSSVLGHCALTGRFRLSNNDTNRVVAECSHLSGRWGEDTDYYSRSNDCENESGGILKSGRFCFSHQVRDFPKIPLADGRKENNKPLQFSPLTISL
jgi:hypothetical protein